MWFYSCDPHAIGHKNANFGGFRCCGNGDKTVLMCHVISGDHMFKGLRGFIDKIFLKQITNLPYLMARGLVVVEI